MTPDVPEQSGSGRDDAGRQVPRESGSGLDGRYLYADASARNSRDPIALTTQVKYMREMGQQNGWNPALILVVVDDRDRIEAGERIRAALNGDAGEAREVDSAA